MIPYPSSIWEGGRSKSPQALEGRGRDDAGRMDVGGGVRGHGRGNRGVVPFSRGGRGTGRLRSILIGTRGG